MKKFKPFNYEEYVNGAPVEFRNGDKPVLVTLAPVSQPDNLMVVAEDAEVYWCWPDGRYQEFQTSSLDLLIVYEDKTEKGWLAVATFPEGSRFFDSTIYPTKEAALEQWGSSSRLLDVIEVEFKV